MTIRLLGQTVALCAIAITAIIGPSPAQSQQQRNDATSLGTIQGYVRDSGGKPVPNADVSLLLVPATKRSSSTPQAATPQVVQADLQGAYRFTALPAGAYSLHAEMKGFGDAITGPLTLAVQETRRIDLVLPAAKASESQAAPETPAVKTTTHAPQFYDEPQFTVAGVTAATNSGGHGSDSVLRTTEELARATASLSGEPTQGPGKDRAGSSSAFSSAANEASLREGVRLDPEEFDANWRLGKLLAADGKPSEAVPYLKEASRINSNHAEVHHLLGDVEEKLGNPLDAARELQYAAELDPSEAYLFDWGAELLTHRALEPATEVFAQGTRLFPHSVQMQIALGVTWYARGSYDQAAQCLATASDLDPANPAPYLFLGKMLSTETTPPAIAIEKLARFVELQSENALANYYYAVALWKQAASADSGHDDNLDRHAERVQSLLQKAARLDPKLGVAYLQLGILDARRGDFSAAISAYEKAIQLSSNHNDTEDDAHEDTLGEAHYRLAQAYLRTGEKAKAQKELRLHDEISKKTKEDAERERRRIQEFVISLRPEK